MASIEAVGVMGDGNSSGGGKITSSGKFLVARMVSSGHFLSKFSGSFRVL